ncbi:MAG: hypothetical protein ACYDCK_01585 [Thermoplasmatota archaeon]
MSALGRLWRELAECGDCLAVMGFAGDYRAATIHGLFEYPIPAEALTCN